MPKKNKKLNADGNAALRARRLGKIRAFLDEATYAIADADYEISADDHEGCVIDEGKLRADIVKAQRLIERAAKLAGIP